MKFTILQNDLLGGLQSIAGVIPTRSTTPILENILFSFEDNVLTVTGTDLEVFISTRVTPKTSEETGAVALPARVVVETVRSLPNIPVTFESDSNHRVRITTDQGVYQLSGLGKENFPEMPVLSNKHEIEISNTLLNRMFSKTIFAVSSEELRPALMGVFLQMDSEEIRMVATDGHRLSKIVNKSIRTDKGVIRIIIPPKAVQLAIRHLDEEGSTRMTIDESGIMFFFDRTTLFSRLVEGEYPDYERVIPRDNDKQMAADKNMLMASVKRVSLFSSALTHQIRFSLNTDRLTVCSEDPDIGGEAKEELAVNYKEDPMEIGYNSQYVLDVLKHIDTDELVFLLKSPVRAALVSPAVQNDDENFIMLVMPIKLST